ncbi:MAG TPA: anthranilate synthase component I family protein [Gaiellaceae bacterium]|nr:anthranilate synthase component I family protein [Gaiellaceae bacterium]
MILELGSVAELEPALAELAFFGRDDVVARVYVGYACSEALRRTGVPAPPEPCPLPAVACSIEPVVPCTPWRPGPYAVGDWRLSWSGAEYAAAVDSVRAEIAEGDVYQANLVQHLWADFDGDPNGVAEALAPLRPLEPEPLAGDGWTIVSASPELLLSRRGSVVRTSPIKGTRPVGVPIESAKDAAEHVMIVDLERNDLSRVCDPASVRWPELLAERELAGVTHLVSTVEGRLRDGVTLTQLLDAVLPGGSVTGCPKIAALDLIAALEPVGRGASMGALGRIHPNGDLDLALTIRTFAIAEGRIHLWVGGGIVWDSDPADEVEESWVKARPLLAAIGAPVAEAVR